MLILREKGDTTLSRIVLEAMSVEFFYINLLKLRFMINGKCECTKIDKNEKTDLDRY